MRSSANRGSPLHDKHPGADSSTARCCWIDQGFRGSRRIIGRHPEDVLRGNVAGENAPPSSRLQYGIGMERHGRAMQVRCRSRASSACSAWRARPRWRLTRRRPVALRRRRCHVPPVAAAGTRLGSVLPPPPMLDLQVAGGGAGRRRAVRILHRRGRQSSAQTSRRHSAAFTFGRPAACFRSGPPAAAPARPAATARRTGQRATGQCPPDPGRQLPAAGCCACAGRRCAAPAPATDRGDSRATQTMAS